MINYVPVSYNPALYMHHSSSSSLQTGYIGNIIGFLIVSLVLLGTAIGFIAMGKDIDIVGAKIAHWGVAIICFLMWLLFICCVLGI